jgi:DNA invertase Pin-like site-specific DNA recombinase
MKTQKSEKPICISYIRFSTPDQIKGNSLTRQLKMSQKYAEEHGLVVDDRFNYQDLGLSAYHGMHKEKGALGLLLELIEKREVPQGSVLLIESLDRLSREKVSDALYLFLGILKKGIRIVTLVDQKEYDKDSDAGQIMHSLGIMTRAYDESATKSKRLKSAWDDKRSELNKKKLTAISPAWLRLNRDNQQFEKIPDRCKLIARIYKLYLDGNGINKITWILNTDKIPSWRSKTGWHRSYIQKILHNRAVLGEFQPHTLNRRQRVPCGEPVMTYYPQIISKEIFDRAQERLLANTKKTRTNSKNKKLVRTYCKMRLLWGSNAIH